MRGNEREKERIIPPVTPPALRPLYLAQTGLGLRNAESVV